MRISEKAKFGCPISRAFLRDVGKTTIYAKAAIDTHNRINRVEICMDFMAQVLLILA
jgi:hypothetical protein